MTAKVFKNVVLLGFVACACVFVVHRLKLRQLRLEENRAVELQDGGYYQQAINGYLDLLAKMTERDKPRIRRYLAECYVGLAEAPDLPAIDQAALYKRAWEYNPDSVTDPIARRLIDRPPSTPEAAGPGP